MHNVADLFDAARRFHKDGDVRQAEQAYRQVVAADPRHALAMKSLALIALGRGDYRAAADNARRAIGVDPARAEFHAVLAEAQRGLGQVTGAVAAYRQAIALAPDYADAHNNLGTLLQAQGDLAAAADSYRRAIEVRPGYAHAHHNLAIVLQLRGQLDAAAEHFAAAAGLKGATADSRLGLGYVLEAQGKIAEATAFFEDAVLGEPELAAAHCGLGYAYQSQGRLDEALASCTRAVELAPAYSVAHYNRATVLRNLGRLHEALAGFVECLRLDSTSVDANVGAAGVLVALGRPDEGVAAARQALALAPRSHAALAQLTAALHAQGDLEGVIATSRRVIEVDPRDAGGHSNLVYALNALESASAEMLLAEHRAWAQRHAEPLTSAAAPHDRTRAGGGRLRIGYVSAHFREHAVSFFSEPMIAAHDHEHFEIYCYSDARKPDETTARFRGYADHWRDTAGMTDLALAQRIRQDQIDILVDLAGHIGGNRLLVFARKPAPVQVTYLGYQNTTGMSAMDYRLTDEHADPPGTTERFYSEQLLRLPRAFFCYQPPQRAPQVNPLPALASGQITLASLNQPIKLRPSTWEAWGRILAAVPEARLLVLAHAGGQFERRARENVERAGVDPARIEVVARRPRYDYLQLHERIDLALDSFPFNGHTTVCDGLWMGVPSIMLEGSSYASRFGGSVLLNVGLGDFIARTPDEYVEIAVRWAGQLDRLAELRGTMRKRLRGSPLLDAAGFTRNLEEAYRGMWSAWRQTG